MARTSKKPAKQTPKFQAGQRVKFTGETFPVGLAYAKVHAVQTGAVGFIYELRLEPTGLVMTMVEDSLSAAAVSPAAMVARLTERFNDRVDEKAAEVAKVLADNARQFGRSVAEGWAGDCIERIVEDTMLAAALQNILRDVCRLDALPVVNSDGRDRQVERPEYRKYLGTMTARWERELLTRDFYRHNCTREAGNIHNQMKWTAMQDARKFVRGLMVTFDRLVEAEGWLAAGLPECGESKVGEFFDW